MYSYVLSYPPNYKCALLLAACEGFAYYWKAAEVQIAQVQCTYQRSIDCAKEHAQHHPQEDVRLTLAQIHTQVGVFRTAVLRCCCPPQGGWSDKSKRTRGIQPTTDTSCFHRCKQIDLRNHFGNVLYPIQRLPAQQMKHSTHMRCEVGANLLTTSIQNSTLRYSF